MVLAIVDGLTFAPELYWMLDHPSWLRCAVLVTNIVTFLFMLSLHDNVRSRVVRSIRLQFCGERAISRLRATVQVCDPDPLSPLALALADLHKHDRGGR